MRKILCLGKSLISVYNPLRIQDNPLLKIAKRQCVLKTTQQILKERLGL